MTLQNLHLPATALTLHRPDTFPQSTYDGVKSAEWEVIRETENHYSHSPVQDVTSSAMTCYELTPGTGAPKITPVTAGSKFTFTVDPSVGHPGPISFWMAKAPSGKTAADFDGKGNVWFKIYQDGPSGLGTGTITWPTQGACPPFPLFWLNQLSYRTRAMLTTILSLRQA